MKTLAWTVAIFGLIAGSIKVYNELEMTKQYARWADASVRQADALERIANGMNAGLFLTNEVVSSQERHETVDDKTLWTTCAPGVTGRIQDCAQIQKRMGVYPWTGRPN